MNKQETRRINPVARIASVAVVLLVVFEIAIIFGALELTAQNVARYAPWAYEPFLKLVGEHPGSAPRRVSVEEAGEKEAAVPPLAGVTGLEPSAIPVLIETNGVVPAANPILEATVPLEIEPESIPVAVPTNAPDNEPPEIDPVG